nr:hypothetical protein Iba_chr04bCG14510 [Ipomoea batatas]GMC91201.1 hypothetical protein Iba_chr04fCG15140 [Ipomoea batatas]
MLTFPPVPPHYAIVTSWTTMQASQYQLHLEAMERQQRMEESFQRALEAQRLEGWFSLVSPYRVHLLVEMAPMTNAGDNVCLLIVEG